MNMTPQERKAHREQLIRERNALEKEGKYLETLLFLNHLKKDAREDALRKVEKMSARWWEIKEELGY